VAVIGIGGVGSYAAEALARSGVGRLTLMDFDVVAPSNLNRQIHALETTLGRPKVEVMAERCRAINPAAAVEPLQEAFHAENAETLLSRGFDAVLDCIDTITDKLLLIETCWKRGIPLFSSMGAANKTDPTAVAVADLFATRNCRMARIMRKELRKRGVGPGVTVVYSSEGFHPDNGDGEAAPPPAGHEGPRRRPPLASSSYIPPIFGLTLAGTVIRFLTKETKS
jgi:tRNA A37 threonylcarbamoyladenosine dehydratase